VENFRQQAFKIIEGIEKTDKADRKPTMMVLDSLGMLPTNKEVNDIADGKNVRDMTRAQLVKSTFRVLTLKLGQVGIPMIMTNHTYDVVGAYVPTKEMSGGSGLKYAASTIVYLSKRKDKDGTDIVGNLIRCKLFKGRLTKENSEVTVQLNYKTGLNKYYGLVDFAVAAGVFEKVSTRIKLPDGKTAFEKQINNDPEKYYTQEVLDKIDEFTRKEFRYDN
jgi:RecA/RadA recombinase